MPYTSCEHEIDTHGDTEHAVNIAGSHATGKLQQLIDELDKTYLSPGGSPVVDTQLCRCCRLAQVLLQQPSCCSKSIQLGDVFQVGIPDDAIVMSQQLAQFVRVAIVNQLADSVGSQVLHPCFTILPNGKTLRQLGTSLA